MFRKVSFEIETAAIKSKYPIMAPIDEQNVRAFRDDKNDRIYHVCLINSAEIRPETLRDQ